MTGLLRLPFLAGSTRHLKYQEGRAGRTTERGGQARHRGGDGVSHSFFSLEFALRLHSIQQCHTHPRNLCHCSSGTPITHEVTGRPGAKYWCLVTYWTSKRPEMGLPLPLLA